MGCAASKPPEPVKSTQAVVAAPKSPGSENKIRGAVGLQNLGNTCFMNSALQCLSNTSLLVDYFFTRDWKKEINSESTLGMRGEIAETFGVLLETVWRQQGPQVVSPYKLWHVVMKYQPRFKANEQQDSHEFLAVLLDGLHEDLNRVKEKPKGENVESDGSRDDFDISADAWRHSQLRDSSIIVDIFQAQLKSTLTCRVCEKILIKFEPFMYLSLSIPADLPIPEDNSPPTIDITECMTRFNRPEELGEACRWFCPKCQAHTESEIKIEMWTAPPILIIHLKRFYQDSKGFRRKNNALVTYPINNFDVTDYVLSSKRCDDCCIYDLFAVSCHTGGLNSGHYTAIAKSRQNKQWYNFNDSKYTPIDESELVSQNAYVLFYRKQSLQACDQRLSFVGMANVGNPNVRGPAVSNKRKAVDQKAIGESVARSLSMLPPSTMTSGVASVATNDNNNNNNSTNNNNNNSTNNNVSSDNNSNNNNNNNNNSNISSNIDNTSDNNNTTNNTTNNNTTNDIDDSLESNEVKISLKKDDGSNSIHRLTRSQSIQKMLDSPRSPSANK